MMKRLQQHRHSTRRTLSALALVLVLPVLAACGDKPKAGQAIRSDAPLPAGTGSNFMQSGWQAGDRASWEAQLKARQQYGQNEYTRVNAK